MSDSPDTLPPAAVQPASPAFDNVVLATGIRLSTTAIGGALIAHGIDQATAGADAQAVVGLVLLLAGECYSLLHRRNTAQKLATAALTPTAQLAAAIKAG